MTSPDDSFECPSPALDQAAPVKTLASSGFRGHTRRQIESGLDSTARDWAREKGPATSKGLLARSGLPWAWTSATYDTLQHFDVAPHRLHQRFSALLP